MSAETIPQHMTALGIANTRRFQRAAIRRAVEAGKLAVRQAAEHPACATATLFDVLAYQRRWGSERARRALREIGASEFVRCRDLTPRQLDAVERATA